MSSKRSKVEPLIYKSCFLSLSFQTFWKRYPTNLFLDLLLNLIEWQSSYEWLSWLLLFLSLIMLVPFSSTWNKLALHKSWHHDLSPILISGLFQYMFIKCANNAHALISINSKMVWKYAVMSSRCISQNIGIVGKQLPALMTFHFKDMKVSCAVGSTESQKLDPEVYRY